MRLLFPYADRRKNYLEKLHFYQFISVTIVEESEFLSLTLFAVKFWGAWYNITNYFFNILYQIEFSSCPIFDVCVVGVGGFV